MSSLTASIRALEDLSEQDRSDWRAWTAARPELASPYFRLEFAEVAARVAPHAAVAVFQRDGRTVGFFPHQRRGGAVQALGAPLNDYHGVVARPGETIGLQTVAEIMAAPRVSVSAWVSPAEGGLACEMLMTRLPTAGFEPWYEERRRDFAKYFKDKERARRSLQADLGPVRVERGLRDPAMLDELIALKREQYRRTGRHDVFACGWTRDLLHALIGTHGTDDFGASMAVLWAGETRVAIELSLHAGDHYHFWFPAYEPSLARCSPGILLSLDTMRLAAADGYRVFDFGFSGEGYKKYFCNERQAVWEATVLRPGLAAGAGRVAAGLLDVAGAERGRRIRNSLRRRWAAIEACEVTPGTRLKGAALAARTALSKMTAAGAAGGDR